MAGATTKRPSLWRNANLVILVGGQWVSQVGNNLFELAIYWYVLAATHHAADLGWVGTAIALPGVLGLFSGVFVDRMDRRWTMIASDVLRAALSGLLGFLALLHMLPLWLFLVLVLLLMAVGTFFNPAAGALVPRLVPSEDLPAANGLLAAAQSSAGLVGEVGGGVLMAALGAVLLFFLNAVSFVVSVVSLVFLRTPRFVPPPQEPGRGADRFFREWLEGLRIFRVFPLLRPLLFVALIVNFAGTGFFTLAAAWVKDLLHGGAFDYALFLASAMLGVIAGSTAAGAVLRRFAIKRVLPVGILVVGAAVVLLSQIPLLWVTLACAVAYGLAVGVINTSLTTLMQRIVPQEKMGRVFGTVGALFTISTPLGAAVAGALAAAWHVGLIYLLLGCLILLGSLPLLRSQPTLATAA